MRTKVTLVLVFLNVALFFFIFKFERTWRTEAALQEARRRVLGSETADIHSLSVSSTLPGGPSYSLVHNRDIWLLTQPLDWPANPHAVSSIIHELQFLENETSFSVADLARSGQSLADYGLDKPKLTVTFTSGEGVTPGAAEAALPTTVLRIGDSTKVGNRLYVLSPDGKRINVVNRSLLDALSVPLDQLRADTLFTIPVFEARALNVQTSGARVRIRRDGSRWLFDTIVNARASKMQMDLTINALNALHAKSFPATRPATLPSAAPTLRVTIDGNNRAETLLLGEPVAGSSAEGGPKESTPQTEYFAQLMNTNTVRAPVFTVVIGNELLEHLRKAQDFLRERRILDLDPTAVTAITLAAPGQPAVTLQRLDPNAADSAWQLTRRAGDATAGQQTMAADSAAVRQLLERLTLLSADRFESDAPSQPQLEQWGFNRPEREITLAVSSTPGASVAPTVLQFGTDASGAVYARAGKPGEPGSSIYRVTADLARDFSVGVTAWRDRTLRTLPATARIVSLKLTDLSSRQTVFETTFDASGKAAKEPASPAALEKLVAGLRTLRARRFVQDRFADQLFVGGDERTWRYQLDTTIALPGGSGAEQTSTSTLFLTDRLGGNQQLAGSKEFDAVFELEQPTLDALWSIAYGPHDPGPPAETTK
ncbi:MAG TPA: DUF4340 domain-containing protein [Opitutaceae bacterium]|nr:DUF4340 domain-containing protein [Opitutaceae bacterium]